jgi:hypothetical protein
MAYYHIQNFLNHKLSQILGISFDLEFDHMQHHRYKEKEFMVYVYKEFMVYMYLTHIQHKIKLG